MPSPANTAPSAATRYTRPAIALHWLIAGLIACGFALGWIMTGLPFSPQKLKFYSWHKWIGMTVLGLAILRALWRLRHPAPPSEPMAAWQHTLAEFAHGMLYALMFALPLSGWLYSSAAGYPVVYLGLVQLPDLIAKNKELAKALVQIHESFGYLLLATVGLHVLGALKHHFVDRDATLRRMLSWR